MSSVLKTYSARKTFLSTRKDPMASFPIPLMDKFLTRIATLHVTLVGDSFRGTITLEATPPHVRQLLDQFEENVESQMFTLADEVEEKIRKLQLRIVLSDGREAPVEDLQVFPSPNLVSFKARQVAPVTR